MKKMKLLMRVCVCLQTVYGKQPCVLPIPEPIGEKVVVFHVLPSTNVVRLTHKLATFPFMICVFDTRYLSKFNIDTLQFIARVITNRFD